MATLEINGTQHEAKCSFAFDRVAKQKYKNFDENGQEIEGFMSIFLGVLSFDNQSLVSFWDCALAHEENRPTVTDIENALEAIIDKTGETEPLFKEVFGAINESGFYKNPVKKFWDGLETVKTAKGTKEEKAAQMQMYEVLTESRAVLTDSNTTKS